MAGPPFCGPFCNFPLLGQVYFATKLQALPPLPALPAAEAPKSEQAQSEEAGMIDASEAGRALAAAEYALRVLDAVGLR